MSLIDFINNIYKRRPRSTYARYTKRVIDFSLAFLGLLLCAPLLLFIMLLLVLVQGGNPFFVQRRVGYHMLPFNVIKFRTMTNARDKDGVLLPDEERTTWIGKILRATSLDELPELINVLRGDMSFIGPRPWVPDQMDIFTIATRARRMMVRPGISGQAQILGRNDLTFRQRVCCDLEYIRNISLWLDIKILCATFYKVIKSEGIAQKPNALKKRRHSNAPKDTHTRGLRGNKPGSQTIPITLLAPTGAIGGTSANTPAGAPATAAGAPGATGIRHKAVPITPFKVNKK